MRDNLKSAIKLAEDIRAVTLKECAELAEQKGREFGEPAVGGAIADAIRALGKTKS